MVLTKDTIQAINLPRIRLRLAVALSCTEYTVIRYLRSNNDNLTKASCLKIIMEETGLPESAILTDSIEGVLFPPHIIPENEYYNTIL